MSSRRNKITFRELKGQRDFNTQYISTFPACLLIFRVSRLPIFFPLSPSVGIKEKDRYFCFLRLSSRPLYLFFFSLGQHIRRGGGSTFQNVCKRPEHPAHPNMVHPAEKSHPFVPTISWVFLLRLTSPTVTWNHRRHPRKIGIDETLFAREVALVSIRQYKLAKRHCVLAGLYRSPVGVVTIDSWSQLFRRLKKERLEF